MRKPYYHISCLEYLIDKNRIPMLFVGSGLSKRYIEGYPTWDELIEYIAECADVTNGQLLAIKQNIKASNPNFTISQVNAEIGSALSQILRDKLISGELKLESLFKEEEINKIRDFNISFEKMLIKKRLENYVLKTGKKYTNELEQLKKLEANIGVVITTNYDEFLEKEVFTNFEAFVEQSQYYMADTTGIGEIYKIHGGISNPNSMIFNSFDYQNFNDNLRVIAAKILNLALDYPIVFIGYSLEDDNVLNIINTLISSLNQDQLNTLSRNLIYVSWKPFMNEIKEYPKDIKYKGKTLSMTCVETDNFFVVYKYLQKFMPAERPERVRKYKKMIKNIVLKNNAGSNNIIATDNLDMLNQEDKLVIAFGSVDDFAEKGIIGITIDEFIKQVLNQKQYRVSSAKLIYENFYQKTVHRGNYAPIYYLNKFITITECEKSKQMKEKLLEWIKQISKYGYFENADDINVDSYNEQNTYRYIPKVVNTYEQGVLSYDQYVKKLKILLEHDPDLINETNFRKAVTYADIKIKRT